MSDSAASSHEVEQNNVPDRLIDALMEAVVLPLDARGRSAAIRILLAEIADALTWLQGPAGHGDKASAAELESLRQLTVAADEHERRMAALLAASHDGARTSEPAEDR